MLHANRWSHVHVNSQHLTENSKLDGIRWSHVHVNSQHLTDNSKLDGIHHPTLQHVES